MLVNVSSIHGTGGAAYASAYVATKFAVRGLSESLRQDVRHEREVHVCTVCPSAIDTSFFQHAANYSGRRVKALRPVVAPERVAAAIVRLAQRPRREVVVGNAGRQLKAMRTVAPRLYDRMNAFLIEKDNVVEQPAAPTDGSLYDPMPDGTGTSAGWQAQPGGRFALAPLAALLVPLGVVALRRR